MVIEGAWGWDAHAGMSWEWVSDVVATDPPLPPTVISKTSKISQRVGDQAAEAEVDGRQALDRQDSARAGGGALPVIMSIIRSSAKPTTTATTTSECAV